MPGHKERELEAFAARKVREEDKALVDSGKTTKEEPIANAEPGCPRSACFDTWN